VLAGVAIRKKGPEQSAEKGLCRNTTTGIMESQQKNGFTRKFEAQCTIQIY
jgi:hypothetical protein